LCAKEQASVGPLYAGEGVTKKAALVDTQKVCVQIVGFCTTDHRNAELRETGAQSRGMIAKNGFGEREWAERGRGILERAGASATL
jgi:hypothetical protein